MATATLVHTPAAPASKLDPTDRTRATFRAAHAIARRMIRQRPGRSTGEALTWFFDHGFRRFGFNAMPIVRAAGWAVFNQLHVTKAATGTREELARQGMLTRAVRVEPAPRGGWSWAWTYDDLGSPNTARSLRRYRAKRLREARAVAREMARDRLAMQAEDRFVLTPLGRAALREAVALA